MAHHLRDQDLGSALARYYIFSMRQFAVDLERYLAEMREGWEVSPLGASYSPAGAPPRQRTKPGQMSPAQGDGGDPREEDCT